MASFIEILKEEILSIVSSQTEADNIPSPVISSTKDEFEGDYTLVVFPYTKLYKKSPAEIGERIGQALVSRLDTITGYNVIQGFLNLIINPNAWTHILAKAEEEAFALQRSNPQKVIVEFASPNTNKPLHLGHIRNILLGWSCSKIKEAVGDEVIKTQIVNDRGIAICKSMLAWSKFGESRTPESEGIKGDHFVGNYYREFDLRLKAEYEHWQKSDGQKVYEDRKKEGEDSATFFKRYKNDYFNEHSELGSEARQMLLKWEDGDEDVRALWQRMNGWVYDGFEMTYKDLGVTFDKLYYESNTYLKGREIAEEGLEKKVFYKEDDGAVWANLEDAGMDKKIILRNDGTSLYITQDLGTAQMRYEDFAMDSAIYVVGDEQDYHFQVLFELLRRLKRPFSNDLYHLSYGMVDLPDGKMKSREGNVVDADDLMSEVIEEVRKNALERGELVDLSEEERKDIYRKVGMAALKYFILKVNPKRRMTFNPAESVDLQGQTGPYIQNAFVRIKSIIRKSTNDNVSGMEGYAPSDLEKEIIKEIYSFPTVVHEAADQLDPSKIANFAFALAKDYHRFYHDHRILSAESQSAFAFRMMLSKVVARVLEKALFLLGIEMPERM